MEKNRTVQRKKSRKKNRPKIRFNFGFFLLLIILSFTACFVLYMLAANMNDNFLKEEFGIESSQPAEEKKSDTVSVGGDVAESLPEGEVPANPVPQSVTADDSYFTKCCLITDKTLLGMKGGSSFGENSVFGSESLTAANAMSERVESSFGDLSAYETVKQKKPQVVYIMLGSELGAVSADEMIVSYTKLVTSLTSALPDLTVYVMQYPPALYDTEVLTNDMINDYNAKLLTMCDSTGVHCIDTNTALKGEGGKLSEEYWSYETLTLSKQGYDKIADYILNHVA